MKLITFFYKTMTNTLSNCCFVCLLKISCFLSANETIKLSCINKEVNSRICSNHIGTRQLFFKNKTISIANNIQRHNTIIPRYPSQLNTFYRIKGLKLYKLLNPNDYTEMNNIKQLQIKYDDNDIFFDYIKMCNYFFTQGYKHLKDLIIDDILFCNTLFETDVIEFERLKTLTVIDNTPCEEVNFMNLTRTKIICPKLEKLRINISHIKFFIDNMNILDNGFGSFEIFVDALKLEEIIFIINLLKIPKKNEFKRIGIILSISQNNINSILTNKYNFKNKAYHLKSLFDWSWVVVYNKTTKKYPLYFGNFSQDSLPSF